MQKLQTVNAETLLYEPLEKPSFVVDSLIPTGLSLFCGSQKIGKGSVTFTVIGNSNSIVWRLYFYFQGRKYRCIGRNFFNWFPAVL